MDLQLSIPWEDKANVGTISRMEEMWHKDTAEGKEIQKNLINYFVSVFKDLYV